MLAANIHERAVGMQCSVTLQLRIAPAVSVALVGLILILDVLHLAGRTTEPELRLGITDV